MGSMIKIIIGPYLVIGVLHVLWFQLSISQTDCAMATGVIKSYCHADLGVAQLIILLGWPFAYF